MESNFIKLLELIKNIPLKPLFLFLLLPFGIEIFLYFYGSLRPYYDNHQNLQLIIWVASISSFILLLITYIGHIISRYRSHKESEKIKEKKDSAFLQEILNLSNSDKRLLLDLYFDDHNEDLFVANKSNFHELKIKNIILLSYGDIGHSYIRISPKTLKLLSNTEKYNIIRDSLPARLKDEFPEL